MLRDFRLQELVNSMPPDKLLSEEEYDSIYKFVESQIKDKSLDVYVGKFCATDG